MIRIGYDCMDSLNCKNSADCRYRSRFKWHNFRVKYHRWLWLNLHIKLPYINLFWKEPKRLSGTKKCPYKKPRRWDCIDCKYCGCSDDGLYKLTCESPVEHLRKYDLVWGNNVCEGFEKSEFADDFWR